MATMKRSFFEQTRALIVALCCFVSALANWGTHWLLSTVLIIGVVVCGTIGFFDVKRAYRHKKKLGQ